MSTTPQLEKRGRDLAAEIKRIGNDEELSGSEKSEALDKIQPDWEAHLKAVENCERASEMNAKLGGAGGDVKDVVTGKSISSKLRSASPYANKGVDLALEALEDPECDKIFNLSEKSVGDTEASREKFNIGWNLGTKDTSQSGNLMGDFLYGTSGPAAIGQQPFGSTGAFSQGTMPTWLPGIVEKLFYELTIGDLISEFPVATPNISYLTESLAVFNANEVAESGTYPWSSEEVARSYAQVGKIANAMTISDEAIADAPTLWNFIQGRLIKGVQRQEEVQILAGSGMPGVGGLLPTFASGFTASSSGSLFGATSATSTNVLFPPAGTNGAGAVSQTVASLPYGRVVAGPTGGAAGTYASAIAIAENLIDAFVDIQLQVFQTPNAIIMHPRDWLTLRLAKDAAGQYLDSSFFGGEYGNKNAVVKSLWDVPVVTTPLWPQHSILTGWFDPTTIQVARRKGITMQMSNSNGTDFVQGNITCRAESRLGLLCYRPSAFQLIQINHD